MGSKGNNTPPIRIPLKKWLSKIPFPPCDPLDVLFVFGVLVFYIINVSWQFIDLPKIDYTPSESEIWVRKLFVLGLDFGTLLGFLIAAIALPFKRVFMKFICWLVVLDYTWEIIDLLVWDNQHANWTLYVQNGLLALAFVFSLLSYARWSIYNLCREIEIETNSAYLIVYPPRNIKTFLGAIIGIGEVGRVKFLIDYSSKRVIYGRNGEEHYHIDKCKYLIKLPVKDIHLFYLNMDRSQNNKGNCITKYKDALKCST